MRTKRKSSSESNSVERDVWYGNNGVAEVTSCE